jgi:hypothetical protein
LIGRNSLRDALERIVKASESRRRDADYRGAALCALTGLTAAVATATISVAANRINKAALSLLKKITACVIL